MFLINGWWPFFYSFTSNFILSVSRPRPGFVLYVFEQLLTHFLFQNKWDSVYDIVFSLNIFVFTPAYAKHVRKTVAISSTLLKGLIKRTLASLSMRKYMVFSWMRKSPWILKVMPVRWMDQHKTWWKQRIVLTCCHRFFVLLLRLCVKARGAREHPFPISG